MPGSLSEEEEEEVCDVHDIMRYYRGDPIADAVCRATALDSTQMPSQQMAAGGWMRVFRDPNEQRATVVPRSSLRGPPPDANVRVHAWPATATEVGPLPRDVWLRVFRWCLDPDPDPEEGRPFITSLRGVCRGFANLVTPSGNRLVTKEGDMLFVVHVPGHTIARRGRKTPIVGVDGDTGRLTVIHSEPVAVCFEHRRWTENES